MIQQGGCLKAINLLLSLVMLNGSETSLLSKEILPSDQDDRIIAKNTYGTFILLYF